MTCFEVLVVIFANNGLYFRPCKVAEQLLGGLVDPIRVEEIASDEGQPVPDICDICGAGDKYQEWVSPDQIFLMIFVVIFMLLVTNIRYG